MQSKLFRLCSMLLVMVMIFNMLPTTAFAAEPGTTKTDVAAEPSDEEVQILGEEESRRTATQKHFRMSDGSFMAVSYGVAVHYPDNTGAWQEINNIPAMPAKADAYTARNGDVLTAYAADLSTGRVLTTSYKDVAVSMGLLDTAQALTMTTDKLTADSQAQLVTGGITYDRKVTATISETDGTGNRYAESAGGWSEEDLIPAGLRSTTVYEDVFPGIDLQYTAFSHHIKEQIIVKEPQTSYRYDFLLSLEGLTAQLNDDGSVTLADEVGEAVYTIPAPYMEDSAGGISTDVAYTLTETKEGTVLTVTADKEWINDGQRVLPVRIDPTLILDVGYTNLDIYTSFAMEAAPDDTTLNWWTLYVGSYPYAPENLQGLYRLFVHFNHLPSIPAGSIITDARFSMHLSEYSGYGVPEIALAAYDVTTELPSAYSDHKAWFNAITWRNQPQYDTGNAYDYVRETTTVAYHFWDLTDAAKSWYFEDSDPTIAIVTEDESVLTVEHYRYAGFNVFGSGNPPLLLVTYRSDAGLEDYYSYTPMSAGRAGTGYINNYTGNLVWVRSDMGFGGSRMPVSINHVYNANDAQNNEFGMGKGWRTNFNQLVYPYTYKDQTFYAWEDGDGTVHYFYDDPDDNSDKWLDEDGLELTLTVSNGYTIEDKYGNKTVFDTYGRLTEQWNNQKTKSKISIAYTSAAGKLISTVTDGANRVYRFGYSDGLLSWISYRGNDNTTRYYTGYTYTDSRLTGIRDNVDDSAPQSAVYGYSGDLLTTATDLGGYKLQFGYQTTATGKNSRVVSVAEYDGTVAGGTLAIEYAHNQTTMKDVSGNVQIMQFNNWGNLKSVQDGEGRAQFGQYGRTESNPNNDTKGNQLTLSSKLQNTVGNLVRDSSFEANSQLWYCSYTGLVNVYYGTGTAYHGNWALRVTRPTSGSQSAGVFHHITVEAGQTYAYSAYVKTVGCQVNLMIEEGSSYYSSTPVPADSDWTRVEMSYTNRGSTARTVAILALTSGAGEFYIDCVQFEKAPTASRYNLVENGDFRHTSDWSSSAGRTTLTGGAAAPELEATVYKMTGDPLTAKRLSQTVKVSGGEGDTFALAGWAKGDSVPIKDNREFAILGTFNYTDGTKKTFTAKFNPDADSDVHWQYSATAMVAEKAYSSITVELAYDYNVNTVYFDGIQLFKEQFGSSYTYDSNGNVTAVKDIQGQTTTYEYSSNNLTKQILPTGATFTYTYDSYHNVKTATTDTGVVYNFEYDTYGNNTSVSIGNGITATASYNNSGNTLYQTTDAAGNTTTYQYNANTNVLEWVKYPKDSDTTRTNYTYDSMYRMATATATTDTGTALTASYTYADDLLTKIQTGSTTYNFGYGSFDLRSSITIGSRTLASYGYTSRTHYLSTLDYGNGDSVDYTYDQQGRVTKETYEDGDTVTYKYDNSGALATVTDSATGRTTAYYYDFTDRMMKYVESGSGYSHSVGYTYDNINNLTALAETINGSIRTTSYAYDDDNRVTSITNSGINKDSAADDVAESYTYDSYGRVHQKITTHGGATILTETYTYRVVSGKQTGQVATMRSVSGGRNVLYTYDYDSNGNIISVSDGTHTTTYSYDSANQLVRENNQAAGVTWVYTYDGAGNIRSKIQYAYTTGSLGSATSNYAYNYGDSSWGDLLTNWNGVSFSYDTIGNITYDGDFTYTWEHGRELSTLAGGGSTWTFAYDANGMRTTRSNGSRTYSYVYNGSSLSQLTVDGHTLRFTYDASGSPISVTYDGTEYYYALNLQGDVVAILNGSGSTVVAYTYDAWGNILSTTGSLSSTLGFYNPLRYRSYVYDTETGLYYVSSRYYDPAICRFINADDVDQLGANSDFISLNLFAYCGNNPVSRADSNGHFWHIVVGAAIGAIANGIITTIGNLMDNDDETSWSNGLGMSLVTGAVTGGFAVTGCGPAVQMLVNAGATAIEGLPGVVDDIKNGEDTLTTLGAYAFEIGFSAVTSYAPGLGSKAAANMGKQTVKRTINAFVHDGFKAGVSEAVKATKWYWKSAKKMIGQISWEQVKGYLNDIADSVISGCIW